jgi:hypothetical protein
MAARKAPKKPRPGKKAATRRAPEAAIQESPSGAAPKPKTKPGGKASSLAVHRAHVFALRPRVSAAFREEDFLAAKRLLEDEAYASLEEAARAVAERALSLSNDPKRRRGGPLGR